MKTITNTKRLDDSKPLFINRSAIRAKSEIVRWKKEIIMESSNPLNLNFKMSY